MVSMFRPGVWIGCVLILLGLLLGYSSVDDLVTRSAEPEALTVEEAAQRMDAGQELSHVMLRDLEVRCDAVSVLRKKAYAPAVGQDGLGRVVVLLELGADQRCEQLAAQPRGSVVEARPWMRRQVELVGDTPLLVLRPHTSVVWMLLAALGLLGGGTYALISGLRVSPTALQVAAADAEAIVEGEGPEGDPFRYSKEEGLLPRPLRPRAAWFRSRRRGSMVAGVLGVAVVAASIAWVASFTADTQRRLVLQEQGMEATEVALSGEERSRAVVFRHVDMAVAYTDAEGTRHHGEVSLWSLGLGIDAKREVWVRYDPEHPEQFVLSTEVETFGGQLLLLLLGAGMLAAVGGSLVLMMRSRGKELAEVREVILAGGHEVLLKLLGEREEAANGQHVRTVYLLALPDGTVLERRRAPADPPYVIDVGKKLVLGLRHPQRPDSVVLLDADLGPLNVTAGEPSRVRERYRDQPQD